MHQIHPDVSLVPLLQRMVENGIKLHLFENDVTPDVDTDLVDFQEPDVNGYAAIAVAAAAFIFTGVDDNRGYVFASPVVFTTVDAGAQQVYGYYMTDDDDTILLACARFDGAPLTFNVSNPREVWPVMGDASRFDS